MRQTAAVSDKEAARPFKVNVPGADFIDLRRPVQAPDGRTGNLNSLCAILGNDLAIRAYREGKVPYPDGTIIAAVHWRHTPSDENNKIFGRRQSFLAGPATNIQFMIKDSRKYADTGGWGFGRFNERAEKRPGDAALLKTCLSRHEKVKDRDLVFTQYVP